MLGRNPDVAHAIRNRSWYGLPARSTIHCSSIASCIATAAREASLWLRGRRRSSGSSINDDCSKLRSELGGIENRATTTAMSTSPARRRSKHSTGSASMMRTVSRGRLAHNRAATEGSRAAAAVENPASLRVPTDARAVPKISAWTRSHWAASSSARSSSTWPAGVTRTPRPSRSTTETPRSADKLRNCWDTADGV